MMRSLAVAALATLVPSVFGKLEYLGVAISGIDFGCEINGKCPSTNVQVPLAAQGGADGEAQMKHFVKDDDMNIFRLPVSWQYLLADKLGGELDDTGFGNYDKLMQACLGTGAYCMIDLHNFARWNGDIVGQGGSVTDDDLVSVWNQLAKKYAQEDKVVFGIMNEPHDLDTKLWADTCQKVVTGIRKSGAKSQIILLPGTNFSSAATFVSTQSADLLGAIKNPDGSKDGLIMDLHQYLDINNSGTHEECTTDNVEGFKTIATWLRQNKRKAIVSETGASMDPTCLSKFCTQNKYLSQNTDVFIGFVGWAAGGFDATYILTLTPTHNSDGSYTDNKLMKQCILGPFQGKVEKPSSSSISTFSTKTTSSATTTATNTADEATVAPTPTGTESNTENAACAMGGSASILTVASLALLIVWGMF